MNYHRNCFFIALIFSCFCSHKLRAETLKPIDPQYPLQDYNTLWQEFDPVSEPIDVEVLNEWEQDGVVLKVIRYHIGVFKGKKSSMAGIYGYPKGQTNLPGLLQVHGGGQYAHSNAVLTNAKRGYATLSIAWAGRISAPGYQVTPREVKLFWEGKTDDPKYKLTTDWGALDAYHAPSRNGQDAFPSIPVAEWTLDPVKSPRNNAWFLITMAGRRGLTFLEQQPEVDGSRLGVYGHSMGGKLTVLIAASDKRVKAAAPSCGGISDRYSEDMMHLATVSDPPSLKRITCPIIFLSPSNDFHGRINDLEQAVRETKSKQWRVSCSPHHNHQDLPEYEVATQVWFDHHLKGGPELPDTADARLSLQKGKLPKLEVKADEWREIVEVEVYFSQQGIMQKPGSKDDSSNTKHRFWKYCEPEKVGGSNTWSAELPVFSSERPLWVFANVHYRMEKPITGAGYYYGIYETDTFILSSLMQVATAEVLSQSGAAVAPHQGLMIEKFSGNWSKDWFSYNRQKWGIRTNKLHEPNWAAPSQDARLSIEVRSADPNIMALWIDGHGVELNLVGGKTWQRFTFPVSSLENAQGDGLTSWEEIRELRLDSLEKLDAPRGSSLKPRKIGGNWQGDPPEFRNLCWIQ